MTKQVELVGNQTINHISNLNAGIEKSFDNIMFQQTKMDHKAYIFIGFLGIIIGTINKNGITNCPINWILGIAILFLLFSLVPITNIIFIEILEKVIKNKSVEQHNIFYHNDIYFLNVDEFKKVLKSEYQLAYYTKFEIKLIEQILVNAKILYIKIFWHNNAYKLLIISLMIYIIFLIGSSFIAIL